jgi:hypothetical protein
VFRNNQILVVILPKFLKRETGSLQAGRIAINKISFYIKGIDNLRCVFYNLSVSLLRFSERLLSPLALGDILKTPLIVV